MGRYSDSDDDRVSRKKRKKNRTSRSRSRSAESDYSTSSRSKHKKSKKSKHKGRSRSRSRSWGRMSRSYERSRQKSRSYDKRRYYSRSRSRSKSRERCRRRRSRSSSYSHSRSPAPASAPKKESAILKDVPGVENMTEEEKMKLQMKMALKAAADADKTLKHMETATTHLSIDDQLERQKQIDVIEDAKFVPAEFKSSRTSNQPATSSNTSVSHDSAMFGQTATSDIVMIEKSSAKSDIEWIAHPSLHVRTEDRMEEWRTKLMKFWDQYPDAFLM